MPKNIPSLKPKELIKILEKGGCRFHREGKGDHRLYRRELEEQCRIVPIDIGARGRSSWICPCVFKIPVVSSADDTIALLLYN